MDSGDARVEDCSNILNSWLRGTEDAENEREAAILMLVKKGEETQKMWLRRGGVVPHDHVRGRNSEWFCVSAPYTQPL